MQEAQQEEVASEVGIKVEAVAAAAASVPVAVAATVLVVEVVGDAGKDIQHPRKPKWGPAQIASIDVYKFIRSGSCVHRKADAAVRLRKTCWLFVIARPRSVGATKALLQSLQSRTSFGSHRLLPGDHGVLCTVYR